MVLVCDSVWFVSVVCDVRWLLSVCSFVGEGVKVVMLMCVVLMLDVRVLNVVVMVVMIELSDIVS